MVNMVATGTLLYFNLTLMPSMGPLANRVNWIRSLVYTFVFGLNVSGAMSILVFKPWVEATSSSADQQYWLWFLTVILCAAIPLISISTALHSLSRRLDKDTEYVCKVARDLIHTYGLKGSKPCPTFTELFNIIRKSKNVLKLEKMSPKTPSRLL